MNEEHFRQLVELVTLLFAVVGPIVPYNEFGLDMGQCRFCGVVGKVKLYQNTVYEHRPECAVETLAKLQEASAPSQGQTREVGKS